MTLTFDQIKSIMPSATTGRINLLLPFLNEAMEKFEINTINRACMFIAQVAHESGQFLYLKELDNGKAYEGRKDLGNIHPGDGVKFKGRGLIQITGAFNYKKVGDALGCDFVSHPELLESPKWAVYSAAWFWRTKALNQVADRGDFKKTTYLINGGYNGQPDRERFYNKAILTIK